MTPVCVFLILTIKTVKALALAATGKAGGYLSAHALALAEEALTTMLGIKGKLVLMVLAIGLAGEFGKRQASSAAAPPEQPVQQAAAAPPRAALPSMFGL